MKIHVPLTILVLSQLLTACGPSAVAGDRAGPDIERAEVVLVPIDDSGVSGSVLFERVADGVHLTGRVEGLKPGEHGFHVHTYGDLTDQKTGKSAGSHFAPDGNPHGRPTDKNRHVGDLGNIEAGKDGVAVIDMTDDDIALSGEHSIIGRALVVHAGTDQFTQPSGDAGARVAFGVIGIAEPPRPE